MTYVSKFEVAGGVISESDDVNRVLLLHRYKRFNQWELPGGKRAEEDRSLAETAVRELKEEIDVQTEVIRELPPTSFITEGVEYEYHLFQATILSGTPAVRELQTHDELRYIDLAQFRAERLGLAPAVLWLRDMIIHGKVDLQAAVV